MSDSLAPKIGIISLSSAPDLSQSTQESQTEEKIISQQATPPEPTQQDLDSRSIPEEYEASLRQEAGEYEAVNESLERAIEQATILLLNEPDLRTEVPKEFEESAQLEFRLAMLEAELTDLQVDPTPSNDPMLSVSELTALELACWQVEDTVKQLREAEKRETERFEDERDKLEHEKILFREAQTLNRILAAEAAQDPVSPQELRSRTQARMLQLQDQFSILQSGLVDFIDHLATSFPQSDLKGVEEDDTASDEKLSLRGYFTHPARNDQDTPEQRAHTMKLVLESLMNESLLDSAGQGIEAGTIREVEAEVERDDYLLRALRRIGMVELRRGQWKLVKAADS